MFAVNVVCYPWDVEDEGIDNVLDRLQGELGVGGVTVVAAGRPTCQLRRRPEVRPRIFQSRGGLFFPPDESKYRTTRCKPIVSGWVKGRDPLAKIADACTRRDMPLRAVIETRRIGRLATRFPDVAVKTAFGDVARETMCISNPDAVELFGGLISDLSASYALSAIELRHLDRTFDNDLVNALEHPEVLPPACRALLAVCFCESCLQSASQWNIDAEAAVRSAQVKLNHALSSEQAVADGLDEFLGDDEVLSKYVARRRAEHMGLIKMLSQRADCDVVLHVSDDAWSDRPPIASIASDCAAIVVAVRTGPPQDGTWTLTEALEACRTCKPTRCEAAVPVGILPSGDATTLVRTMRQLVDLGVTGVNLEHYGWMGDRELTSAQQAIRYAKRSAAE